MFHRLVILAELELSVHEEAFVEPLRSQSIQTS